MSAAGTFTIWFNDQNKEGLSFQGITENDAAHYAKALREKRSITIVEPSGIRTDTTHITDTSHTSWTPPSDA